MANRYWVGGSGTWNTTTTTNWSAVSGGLGGASRPTAGDNVFFDQPGAYTVTMNAGNCLNCTVSAGTVDFAGTNLTSIFVYGNLTFTAETTWSSISNLWFRSSTTGQTITTNDCVINSANIYFDGIGGEWNLTDNLTTAVTTPITLTNGSLVLNNKNINTGTFVSTNSNARSINFGTGTITIATPTSGTSTLNIGNATNFTWTGTGGFVSNGDVTRNFALGTASGGSTSNAVNLTINSGASAIGLGGSWFNKLNFIGNTSTITGNPVTIVNSIILDPSGVYRSLYIKIVTSGTIVTTNSNETLHSIDINCPDNSFSLTSPISLFDGGSSANIILTAGNLNLNGYDLTTKIFASSNTNVRSIAFGTNTILLSSLDSGALTMAVATNFTWTGSGKFASEMSVNKTISFGSSGGASIDNAINLSIISGTLLPSITSGSWFKTLDYTGSATGVNTTAINVSNLILGDGTYGSLSAAMVGTGTLNGNYKTISSLNINCPAGITTLTSPLTVSATGTTTLTSGTLNLNNNDLNTGIFSSNNTNSRSIIFGNNSIGLNYVASGTAVLNMVDATGFTCSGQGGFSCFTGVGKVFNFGSGGGASINNYPNLTMIGAGPAAFGTGNWFNKVDLSQSSGNATATTVNLGSLVLGTGTYTNLVSTMVGTGSITTGGKSLTTLTINTPGTVTITDDLNITTSITLAAGTLALSGLIINTSQFISGAAAIRAITGSGTVNVSNDWTVTDGAGFTGSAYTVNMLKSTAKTFAGAGGSYGTLTQSGAGALTVSGSNSFANILTSILPTTINFTAGTTQTVANFSLNGLLGNLVSLASTTPGSKFTLSKASGTVTPSYLSIQDSNALGGAKWDVSNKTNVDLGNNGGWIFNISTVNGQFMAFFF